MHSKFQIVWLEVEWPAEKVSESNQSRKSSVSNRNSSWLDKTEALTELLNVKGANPKTVVIVVKTIGLI